MSVQHQGLVEQLFLDLPVDDIVRRVDGLQLVEPWANQYVDAINTTRYGDAIWARYHIFGDVVDGKIEGKTVLESITKHAMGYKMYSEEQFIEAVSFYKGTSKADGHPEVM
ncbi:hypothetical protein SNK03_009197 [Fusarium graminearum]